MLEQRLKAFISNECYNDFLRYKGYIEEKSKNESNQNIDGQWSYITEVMIVTIKSLIPSKEVVGTIIDYERFNKELNLWYYYRHGHNKSILNSIMKKSSEVYWNELDDTTYIRVFSIVAANTNWEVIRNEVIKNLVYTTGNISNILECLALAKLLYLILDGVSEYDEVLEGVKKAVIHFSQTEFLEKFKDNFIFKFETYPYNYTIDFERKRINLISMLNGFSSGKGFEVLYGCLNILNNNEFDKENNEKNYFIAGFKGLSEKEEECSNFKDRNFIVSLGGYLYKLRKSRISPESLEVKGYNMPDIFSFKQGDTFKHTLLNVGKVLSIEEKSKYIISYIKTKTGIYRFFKLKNK